MNQVLTAIAAASCAHATHPRLRRTHVRGRRRPPSSTATNGAGLDCASTWTTSARSHATRRPTPRCCAPAPGQRRVVFFGDSITDNWDAPGFGGFFPGKPYVNRGISGQTTSQMLLRYRADVIDLNPRRGRDPGRHQRRRRQRGARSTPAISSRTTCVSMTELAQTFNGVRVVLALGAAGSATTRGRPGLRPAGTVRSDQCTWLRDYARGHDAVYLDYHDALANAQGAAWTRELAADGVHPTPAGYAVMAPLAERAIARALLR